MNRKSNINGFDLPTPWAIRTPAPEPARVVLLADVPFPRDVYRGPDKACACGFINGHGPRCWLGKPAETKQSGWTLHTRCRADWNHCEHFAGSDLHVFGIGTGEYYVCQKTFIQVHTNGGFDGNTLFEGGQDECKRFVEALARKEGLPEGWSLRPEHLVTFDHVSGAYVSQCIDSKYWEAVAPNGQTRKRVPGRAEAMAASLGFDVYRVLGDTWSGFCWAKLGHGDHSSNAPPGDYPTAEIAALAALAFNANGAKCPPP